MVSDELRELISTAGQREKERADEACRESADRDEMRRRELDEIAERVRSVTEVDARLIFRWIDSSDGFSVRRAMAEANLRSIAIGCGILLEPSGLWVFQHLKYFGNRRYAATTPEDLVNYAGQLAVTALAEVVRKGEILHVIERQLRKDIAS